MYNNNFSFVGKVKSSGFFAPECGPDLADGASGGVGEVVVFPPADPLLQSGFFLSCRVPAIRKR